MKKKQKKGRCAWLTSPKKQMNAKTGPGAPGDEAHEVAARTRPRGAGKGENEKGMRWRAQAGWGLTRVRPGWRVEDRVQQTASAPAGP
ncbi:hypothetical protein ACINB_29860 [Acidovorax sp. NB1]|nr:hypothetical protein ACINB_29860 [Acidovorax sp. NB1]